METESAGWPQNGAAVEVVPAYEVVAQRLRRAIHLGELPPGSKLPPERILSQRLGVSRITLREAIRVLEGEGYVGVGRGSRGGTTVRSGEMRPAEVRAWMRKRRPELDALFQFRRINEAGAAERAATRVRPADIAELRDLVELTRESGDVSAFRSADVRFHMRIAELADSTLLRNAVEEARAALYVPFRAFPLEQMHDVSVPRHIAIVDALEQGDPDAAAAAMEAHLLTTEEQLNKLRESRS
jgi:DNA-binding FadR family transcriptional regulator